MSRKLFHKVTITVRNGPLMTEAQSPGLGHKFSVNFYHTTLRATIKSLGYFAADGRAAYSSATAGNVWRSHFRPTEEGVWSYKLSFEVAGDVYPALHGVSGELNISASDKSGSDLRSPKKGPLRPAGGRYLQFAGGERYLKAGVDSPENLLAYLEFDGE